MYNVQFVNVYAPKYGTGGKFWEIAHSCMIFLYYSCMVSLWEYTHWRGSPTHQLHWCSFSTSTLVFNGYCRKRSLPNFYAYSAEVSSVAIILQYYSSTPPTADLNTARCSQTLIKKDRDDENDPAIAEYLDKLVTIIWWPCLDSCKLQRKCR